VSSLVKSSLIKEAPIFLMGRDKTLFCPYIVLATQKGSRCETPKSGRTYIPVCPGQVLKRIRRIENLSYRENCKGGFETRLYDFCIHWMHSLVRFFGRLAAGGLPQNDQKNCQ